MPKATQLARMSQRRRRCRQRYIQGAMKTANNTEYRAVSLSTPANSSSMFYISLAGQQVQESGSGVIALHDHYHPVIDQAALHRPYVAIVRTGILPLAI